MLEHFYSVRFRLERLRCVDIGGHIECFAGYLKEQGYSRSIAYKYIPIAAHLFSFLRHNNVGLESFSTKLLEQFEGHLDQCDCPSPKGSLGRDGRKGVRAFYKYLRGTGVLRAIDKNEAKSIQPPLLQSYRHWMRQHCGAADSTLRQYSRGIAQLLVALGDDPSQYDAAALRAFVLERARHSGRGATQALIKSLRSFLCYLATQRKCSAALAKAIPSPAGWRLSSLPRYLSDSELKQTLDACDVDTHQGVRDRAILLLMVRLGLRASDVAGLRLFNFDWQDATVVVSGKSRRETRLPLPQDVGDAVLQYLEQRSHLETDYVFLRIPAPRSSLSSTGVSTIASRAMRRAGLSTPNGAHILRHTAATQMLRQGVSLDAIRTLLRHRSVDTTATYAKVDLALLRRVTQPWPEVLR